MLLLLFFIIIIRCATVLFAVALLMKINRTRFGVHFNQVIEYRIEYECPSGLTFMPHARHTSIYHVNIIFFCVAVKFIHWWDGPQT